MKQLSLGSFAFSPVDKSRAASLHDAPPSGNGHIPVASHHHNPLSKFGTLFRRKPKPTSGGPHINLAASENFMEDETDWPSPQRNHEPGSRKSAHPPVTERSGDYQANSPQVTPRHKPQVMAAHTWRANRGSHNHNEPANRGRPVEPANRHRASWRSRATQSRRVGRVLVRRCCPTWSEDLPARTFVATRVQSSRRSSGCPTRLPAVCSCKPTRLVRASVTYNPAI